MNGRPQRRRGGDWEKDFLCLLPGAGTPGADQGRECLEGLRSALRERSAGPGAVVKATFFVRAAGAEDYRRRKGALEADLRAILPSARPAVGVVGEPPEGGRFAALEAVVLRRPSRSVETIPKSYRGLPYVLLRAAGGREVFVGGLSGGRKGDLGARASAAFATASRILAREGLSFSDVLRQWNYLEDITGGARQERRVLQNYQIFNDIRAMAYERAGLREAFPAATGIGQSAGGFVLELIAAAGTAAERAFPISNPLQADAHRYSASVLIGSPVPGRRRRSAPKFERAKVVLRGGAGVCYVSGTAAIVGQKVVRPDDVGGQTRATIRNIERLVAPANLRRSGAPVASLGPGFSYVRTYVKRERDLPEVARIVTGAFGRVPRLCVQAGVCREDLLVEIEGAIEVLTE